ncbi:MAG: hypothetical protein V3S14_07160, partial [Anaerolineae bacterium]
GEHWMPAMRDVDELVATVIEVAGGRVTASTWMARWGCSRGTPAMYSLPQYAHLLAGVAGQGFPQRGFRSRIPGSRRR